MVAQTHIYLVLVYLAYATLGFTLTLWLARTLFRNGAVFLEEVFADNPRMAQSVNHLLVVGFYLFNVGYACLTLRAGPDEAATPIAAIEVLSAKLGLLLVSLAVMHFFNMYLFHRIRRRGQLQALPPPVAPHFQVG